MLVETWILKDLLTRAQKEVRNMVEKNLYLLREYLSHKQTRVDVDIEDTAGERSEENVEYVIGNYK